MGRSADRATPGELSHDVAEMGFSCLKYLLCLYMAQRQTNIRSITLYDEKQKHPELKVPATFGGNSLENDRFLLFCFKYYNMLVF